MLLSTLLLIAWVGLAIGDPQQKDILTKTTTPVSGILQPMTPQTFTPENIQVTTLLKIQAVPILEGEYSTLKEMHVFLEDNEEQIDIRSQQMSLDVMDENKTEIVNGSLQLRFDHPNLALDEIEKYGIVYNGSQRFLSLLKMGKEKQKKIPMNEFILTTVPIPTPMSRKTFLTNLAEQTETLSDKLRIFNESKIYSTLLQDYKMKNENNIRNVLNLTTTIAGTKQFNPIKFISNSKNITFPNSNFSFVIDTEKSNESLIADTKLLNDYIELPENLRVKKKVLASSLQKLKTFLNISDTINAYSTKRKNRLSLQGSRALQDKGSRVLTPSTGFFTQNSDNLNDRSNRDNKKQQNGHIQETIPQTTVVYLASTTTVSHMNDPPFKGPNVLVENIYNFQKEKNKGNVDYDIQNPSFEIFSNTYLSTGEEWPKGTETWRTVWEYHCYVTGSLFAVIALYSLISLLRVKAVIPLLKTEYYITINFIILLTCALRALYLTYDPHNVAGKYPVKVSRILLNTTLPSLSTCFCLLVISLLNLTQTYCLSSKLQKASVLAFIIVFYFPIGIEALISFVRTTKIVFTVCYLVTSSCVSLSSLCYFLIFKKLHTQALRKQGEMIRLTFTKMHIDGAQLPKKLPKPTLCMAVKWVLAGAFIQLLLCFLSMYAIIYFENRFYENKTLSPWLWWGYQLACRITELLMAGVLSFVATQPIKHFEDNHFCSLIMWCPCRSFIECFRHKELVNFEAHSDNYANLHGIRGTSRKAVNEARRMQANSLPIFRTPLSEIDNNLPMSTLPCTGRHTNHASALSLLSYYRSKRTLTDEDFSTNRPASMLYKDNGFIRFRRTNDPEQPMEMSDEDDRLQEVDTSFEDADSTTANAGSSFHSLLESDVVQNTFFHMGYKRRKMSRLSIETVNYSADISPDQLSSVVNLKNGLSTSALDFNTRKYGSTCSSESAANSFDVTFFLNNNSSPQISPISITLNVGSAYRSETEDDKTSSVEGHEVILRSVSPIVKRASSGRLSLNLNLYSSNDSNGHVNRACGTEDITPDSAVYFDLHLSSPSSCIPQQAFPLNRKLPIILSPEDTKSSDRISPETTSASPSFSFTSQSLNELRASSSYVVSGKKSRGFLDRLRNSTFSLNTSFHGYEPLELVEARSNIGYREHERPHSESHLEFQSDILGMGDSSSHLGDSGLLGDCSVALVDAASQTDDIECSTNYCKHVTTNSSSTFLPIRQTNQ